MPKRKRTSAEAKQGAQFRDLPDSIVKEHLLPFLCHESWYDGHQFIFEQIMGVGHRMVEHGSWKHAGFEWARDISQLACTNRAMWKALGSVSLQALRRNRDCHVLFLNHALRELYRLQGLPLWGDLFNGDDVALNLLPKEEARRSILMRHKVASFPAKASSASVATRLGARIEELFPARPRRGATPAGGPQVPLRRWRRRCDLLVSPCRGFSRNGETPSSRQKSSLKAARAPHEST